MSMSRLRATKEGAAEVHDERARCDQPPGFAQEEPCRDHRFLAGRRKEIGEDQAAEQEELGVRPGQVQGEEEEDGEPDRNAEPGRPVKRGIGMEQGVLKGRGSDHLR